MQEANFEGLLKAIFYIIVFIYVFKFLARLLLPVVVKKVVQKAEQSFHQQYGGFQQQTQYAQDEIIVDTAKSSKPRETKKVGEYVDYEEIE
ncbi:DUF4834 family protein [Flavobacterium sp. 3HN19-14]|uniref:DUF4834 family protein n=1 Tax=Flavobacterium sp. 3HN19-14 TaxID=3448133 RepID=UPI003EE187C2